MKRKTKNLFDSLEDLLEIKIKKKSVFPDLSEIFRRYYISGAYSNLASEYIDASQPIHQHNQINGQVYRDSFGYYTYSYGQREPIYYTTYTTTDSYNAHNIAANWSVASDGVYYNSVNTGDINVRN